MGDRPRSAERTRFDLYLSITDLKGSWKAVARGVD